MSVLNFDFCYLLSINSMIWGLLWSMMKFDVKEKYIRGIIQNIICVIIVDCIGKLSMKQWMCKNG